MKKAISSIGFVTLLLGIAPIATAGTWTILDMPGASGTFAQGISGSNIVGRYTIGPDWYSFLYNGSTWTTLDMPGAANTTALGIDGSNIVGGYRYGTSSHHGFLYDGSNWTTLDIPGAQGIAACGIDGSNIVGYYVDASSWPTRSFLYTIPEPTTFFLFALGAVILKNLKNRKAHLPDPKF